MTILHKILDVVHGSPESEPIYLLESEYNSFESDEKKQDFLNNIKTLALNGDDNEKFICLTVIEFINKAKECEDVIKRVLDSIEINENEKTLSPLLTLCAAISTDWSIDFIIRVIKFFKPKHVEYSYYYDIGIRSMLSTFRWKETINEIKWTLGNYDDEYNIDLLAYFKWKRGDQDLLTLFQLLNDSLALSNKVKRIKSKIDDRYANNYMKILKNK